MSRQRLGVIAAWLLVSSLGCAAHDGANGLAHRDAGSGSDGGRSSNAADGGGPGSSGSGADGAVPSHSSGHNNCQPPTSLALSPGAKTAAVSLGGAFSLSYKVTATYANHTTADVTSASLLSLDDPGLGSFAGGTFKWAGTHGGTVDIHALHCGVTTSTTLTLSFSAAVSAGSGPNAVDPAAAAKRFGSAPSSSKATCAPKLVYPPDQVLLPPNANVIEVHFLSGSPANDLFEISFANAITDVRIYTHCAGTTASEGMPLNGGCVFELDQKEWDYIARTNRDSAAINVEVRGLGCDGSAAASSSTRQISFAKDDVAGTLYYWASMRAIVVAGQTVNSGGVFRYDFGVRGQSPEPVLTPSSAANPTGLCIGCHTVSRDGRQMIFDFDDNDDDDEYGDVRTDIFDIAAAKAVTTIAKNSANAFPPGYHTWNREAQQFLLTDGPGTSATPAGALRRVSASATTLGFTQPGTLRATTPDWSPDDKSVVFAVPPAVSAKPPNAGFWQSGRDLWFAGASLYTAPWNASTNQLGAPTQLLAASSGSNLYYPSYSPDGSLIVFNYAASGPNFHNPLARVQVLAAGQAKPTAVDLAKLNDTGSLTNSWARWSPFVQSYKGGHILWVTLSSTRDYGLRISNAGKQNCYPTESPLTPTFNNTSNCTRAQLWMAAIALDPAAVKAGKDVSWPAFWLPFQDITTNNHLAQWAQKSFKGTCGSADAGATTCAAGYCCEQGGCAVCSTPPVSAPTCTSDPNCAPGNCCIGGACVACPNTDAGTGPAADGGTKTQCNTCLDCSGQACNAGACGSCTSSSQCCAPLACVSGRCIVIRPE